MLCFVPIVQPFLRCREPQHSWSADSVITLFTAHFPHQFCFSDLSLETYHQWKHSLIIYVLCFSTVQHLQDQGHSQEFPIGLGNSLVQAQECGESAVKCSKGFSPQSTRVSAGTRDLGQSFHVVSDHGPWLVALIELLLLPLLHCTCSL